MPLLKLEERIKNREAVIAVIGLGYVGLPLALGFADAGIKVIGLDVDQVKTEVLSRGDSYISYISPSRIRSAIEARKFETSTDLVRVAEVDVIIICVPTPIGAHREPDLSYITGTISAIRPGLRRGQLISLESTTYPGTTEELLCDSLANIGFVAGKDLAFVYSPEREDPGNQIFAGNKIPKLVGGITDKCRELGVALYGAVFETVVPVSSPKVAEFAKLLENTFRAVNIGMVNEMKTVADRLGIDIWEVIQAASTKPFGFTPFYPGPGVGGHCIPVDPFYLTWKAREVGIHTRFVELAAEINESMPAYVVNRTNEILNDRKIPMKGSRVLVLGLAFKADVQDIRGSPTFGIMDELARLQASVAYHDPFVPEIPMTREHGRWAGLTSVEWSEASFSSYAVVIISTAHNAFRLQDLVDWCPCIIDTRNVMAGIKTNPGQVHKA